MKKKTLTTIVALLLVAVAATAQGVKISPKMEKGMRKVYNSETTMSLAGMKDIKMEGQTEYVVSEVADDGYVLDVTLVDMQSDVAQNDMAAWMMLFNDMLMKDLTIRLKTDLDGQPQSIVNYDELKQKVADAADAMLNKLYADMPGMEQMAPRDMLMNQVMTAITEETLLASNRNTAGVTALNGKTVATGATESYTSDQGLKMKRTYLLTQKDGSAVTVSARLDMTTDELKQMMIDRVAQTMPEQVEVIKQNIDLMMGQMKFDATETDIYTLAPDRWVKTLTVSMVSDMMGQNIVVNTKTTLKE